MKIRMPLRLMSSSCMGEGVGNSWIVLNQQGSTFQSRREHRDPQTSQSERRGEIQPMDVKAGLIKRRLHKPIGVNDLTDEHQCGQKAEGLRILFRGTK